MRAFCTVSAPLEVCASSAEQLSPGSRFLALRLLGNQQPKTLYFLVDAKSRVREVYTQTCLHFATQGMQDTELFGLAVLIDGEYMFADPESKLSKYGPKSWRSSHTHGLDANGRPLLELHFRVQFYIESPFMLKDEPSRHNYYLQLKYNALQRDILREYSEQSMILLAGLALQADYGDAPLTTLKSAITTTTLNTTTTTAKSDEGNATEAAAAVKAENVANGNSSVDSSNECKTKATTSNATLAAATATTTSFTTTLPKISKKTNSANERMLRLSTYVASTSQQQQVAATTNGAATSATSTSSTSSVFPISGSIKRGLGAMAATLSPSSSLLALNRGQKAATATTATTATAVTSQHATTNENSTTAELTSNSAADYFRLEDYLPAGLRTMWAANALRACHRENRGMSAADAELHYIQQACLVHESINAHTFRMRMSKSENGPGNSWFVIYAKGIKIFDGSDQSSQQQPPNSQQRKHQQQQQTTFLWPNITKLSFERKKFEIRSGDSKIVLYATSDEKNKMLLTLCKETHQFSMKMAARLKEIIKRDDEENNCLHACYNYSRSLHLTYKNKSDQRISVISSTSSNTTSGIVSDRVHSEDELEIMINSPPAPIAAPSTESLALAHLLDHPSVSRQTSSVGQVSLKELEEQLAALSVRQAQKQHGNKLSKSVSGDSPIQEQSIHSAGNSFSSGSIPTTSQRTADSSGTTDSPNSQHNIGSQCSSTCSTVVVTSQTETASNVFTSVHRDGLTTTSTPTQRRNSTSSSLELGFSHTAQNSTLSEAASSCIEHNFSASTQDGTESISGVYTLAHGAPPTETSGVYTMHSSELTGQSSELAESENQSSHYGSFHPAKSEISDDHLREDHADSVDGNNYVQTTAGKRLKNNEFRLRSDSNISTSGSFRGDGSDPTDNKHNLLTAEELTELIVGRGSYPSRKTVSNNLDSDCDYVTLPLSIAGESYIQGHQDTAPTEDQVEELLNDLLPTEPPAPPQRIDSNNLPTSTHASLSNIRMRSPPPYNARHETTGLRGPLVRNLLPVTAPQTATIAAASTAVLPSACHTKVPSKVAIKTAPEKVKAEKCADKQPAVVQQPAQAFNQANAAIRRRDPPPYPVGSKPRPTSLISVAPSVASLETPLPTVGGSTTSLKSEEATARFITSRPQINILKAHASVVNENAKPSYAAPTHCSSTASSIGSVSNYHIPSHLSQNSTHNSNYASGSQVSLNLANHLHSIAPKTHAAGAGVIPSTIGIPIVPYGLHGAHKSMSSLHHQPPPYAELKTTARPTCVLLPVIKSRQFIPPPPPSLPRQPPPPPPTQLGVYATSQLARKQLELYQQQLYSDVDYVIYPIQDPAVSQQEYIDAKQSSLLAAMTQAAPPPPHPYLAAYHTTSPHPGPWDTCKGHAIYRSTPYLPLALSAHSRYASTQNLSDTYVQLPSAYSPLYSPSVASLCSSYEPPPPPPLHPAALTAAANQSNYFGRSRSDDNILNTLDALPKIKRLPPPPPPPYVNRRLKKPPMPAPPTEKPPPIPSKSSTTTNSTHSTTQKPTRSSQLSLATSGKPVTLRTSRSTSHMTKTSSGAHWAGERPKTDLELNRLTNSNNSILAQLQASLAAANRQSLSLSSSTSKSSTTATSSAKKNALSGSAAAAAAAAAAAKAEALDIALLREKSKNLDLPLISALCNDRSLLKQTKVLADGKHARNSTANTTTTTTAAAATPSNVASSSTTNNNHNSTPSITSTTNATLNATAASTSSSSNQSLSNKNQTTINSKPATTATATPTASTPTTTVNGTSNINNNNNNIINNVNGGTPTSAIKYHSNSNSLSATLGSASKARKALISHRHPNDKLPPLPMQLAEANNYVMDPAVMLKHHQKSHNNNNNNANNTNNA